MRKQKFYYTSHSQTGRSRREGGTLLKIEGTYYTYKDCDGEEGCIDISTTMIDDRTLNGETIARPRQSSKV